MEAPGQGGGMRKGGGLCEQSGRSAAGVWGGVPLRVIGSVALHHTLPCVTLLLPPPPPAAAVRIPEHAAAEWARARGELEASSVAVAFLSLLPSALLLSQSHSSVALFNCRCVPPPCTGAVLQSEETNYLQISNMVTPEVLADDAEYDDVSAAMALSSCRAAELHCTAVLRCAELCCAHRGQLPIII